MIRLAINSNNIFRLCGSKNPQILNNLTPLYLETSINTYSIRKRHFSLQSKIEPIITTQTGIFKSLSESTPVEYLQNFLLEFHDISGLPWWATILCTTVLLRTCVTLPLSIYQYYILAKLENLKLEMPAIVKELKKETAIGIKLYNWDEKTTRFIYNRSVKKQWNNLIIRDNCHPFKASLLMLFQIPMWISFSVALRNLVYMLPNSNLTAKLTYLELSLGGFGFIPNLTEVDSSLILPVMLGLINLSIIELQVMSKIDAPSKFQRRVTIFFRGLSILFVPIAASVPSGIVLYWTASSTYGLIQNMILISPRIKRICRIPETSRELKEPYKHIVDRIRNKFNLLPKSN